MKYGDILAEVLQDHHVTQKELGERLNLTPSTIGNYIHNIREPNFKTIKRIAEMFDVSLDYFFDHRAGPRSAQHTENRSEERMLFIFRGLPAKQQKLVLKFCMLLSQMEHEEEHEEEHAGEPPCEAPKETEPSV